LDLPDTSSSLWQPEATTRYAPLDGDLDADVVVVGAGITGLTTAVALAEEGRDVVVLEGRVVGAGTSTRTTAKVSALQGLRYRTIIRIHGPAAARGYAAAQLEGLTWMASQVANHGIDCSWEARPAVTYATSDQGRRHVEEEAVAATDAGLDVELADADLPFPTTAAVWLQDQAQLNPAPYLAALADRVDAAPTGRIHESSRVRTIRGHRGFDVVTDSGTVRARHVVVATLLPIVDRGLFFARAEPKSSYLVALRTDGVVPRAMYLSADSPTRSTRTAPDGDSTVLLVGGAGHDTGRGRPTGERYRELTSWAAQHFPVRDVVARWSAHDYVPADHLPFVGQASPLSPGLLVATGFEKWGMTMGTAAGLALAERLSTASSVRTGEWADLFAPGRASLRGLANAARINADVAVRLASDWLDPASDPGPDGAGGRHREGLRPVSEPAAAAPAVSVVCTHLGGVCEWNDGDRTWDCPLHGSRFEADGDVLTGPATRPLRRSSGPEGS